MRCKGHRERKCENQFLLISSPNVDRFGSQRLSTVHFTHNVQYISLAEMLRFRDVYLKLSRRAAYRSGHLAVHLYSFGRDSAGACNEMLDDNF